MSTRPDIAIVGIGCAFPDAPDPDTFWNHIQAARSAAREVPPGRWALDSREAYDPGASSIDKVYSRRACFLDLNTLRTDDAALEIPQELIDRMDPLFRVLLHAGQQACRDVRSADWNRARTGIIIGNLALPTESASRMAWECYGHTIEEQVLGSAPERRTHFLNRYVAGLPALFLANALGFKGVSYTLDAACASSLYAIKLATDELISGRADVMLAGGVSRPDSLYTQMGFSQLRAVSPSGICSPFCENGDGLVVGEGSGILVLKRLHDAVQAGDHIYGVIRGIGLSNDVGGRLLAPTSEGQLRAMAAAYAQAGWSASQVDHIECHATGTPVGDAVEFESMRTLWNGEEWKSGQCVIGSVKSNIGHLLTAAGSAALIKTLMALKHHQLPPTAHFTKAPASMDLEHSPFRVLTAPCEWKAREKNQPRRAAVSAFGFGGINAHVLVEEWIPPATAAQLAIPEIASRPDVAIVGMAAHIGPWSTLRAFQQRVLGGDDGDAFRGHGRWRGADQSEWFQAGTGHGASISGAFLQEVPVPLGVFRIPPKELEEMLPQQVLALQTAATAWADAGRTAAGDVRAGVFLGVSLDLNTTNFHVRWMMSPKAREWASRLNYDLDSEAIEEWTQQLREAAGPPLTANRTMGGLASVAASRIARELRLGGPSFTISSEDCSGLHALDAAVRSLQDFTVDTALTGAVDFGGDLRAFLGADEHRPFSRSGAPRPLSSGADGPVIAEGAVALVLKRLEDAVRDGDRIYSVIRGIGTATAADADLGRARADASALAIEQAYAAAGVSPRATSLVETGATGNAEEDARVLQALSDAYGKNRPHPCAVSCAQGWIGHAGAASGLASLAAAALSLYQEILPPLASAENLRPELSRGQSPFFAPDLPQYWLRNRAEGPRRAGVHCAGVGGASVHVLLEAHESAQKRLRDTERVQPLGGLREAIFYVEGDTHRELIEQLNQLRTYVETTTDAGLEQMARRRMTQQGYHPNRALAVSMVPRTRSELLEQLAYAARHLSERPELSLGAQSGAISVRDRVFYSYTPNGKAGRVAFVFPGSGNHFARMGQELFAHFPEVLREQDRKNLYLAGQFQPGYFWNTDALANPDNSQKAIIFGQVALGTAVSDLMRRLSLHPEAVIGYSLGETAGLFALDVWTERDEMLNRINASPLFTTELAGDCDAARRTWQLPKHEAVDWVLGVIDRPMKVAKAALKNRKKVYTLIANTMQECVIGGNRKAVEKLIRHLQCQFIPIEGVSTVHCEVVKSVEQTYRDLHLLNTTPSPNVLFYSGAWGKAYPVTRESAAESILAQAVEGVDFPKVIEAAYEKGFRVFLEMGPGNSCSRMIDRILAKDAHLARSVCYAGQEPVSLVLRTLANLIAERVPVDLDYLYRTDPRVTVLDAAEDAPSAGVLLVPVGGEPFRIPRPAKRERRVVEPPPPQPAPQVPAFAPPPVMPMPVPAVAGMPAAFNWDPFAKAHAAFLSFTGAIQKAMADNLSVQMALLGGMAPPSEETLASEITAMARTHSAAAPRVESTPRALDRAQCLTFAVGRIGDVLGPEYAAVDSYPTRVRLPDEPLMLVDRITAIEGEPRSLKPGRVVTEHDVLPGAWYLDSGRIPTCIAVEAGQADLFLSGFLGIDFQCKGLSMYRLLDADVTFYRGLPKAGDTIRYDIHIEEFFRLGNPWFFRFHFDGTVNGEPLLSMRNGCAGFFTQQELAEGQGVMDTRATRTQSAGRRPEDWSALAAMSNESYTDEQVDALRRGDFAACFGPQFDSLALQRPLGLPSDRMRLVHRVLSIEPEGGRHGIGFIRAEADIHPDDWFLTCHFVDDRVMPGTLMYECCMHTFRIFLMRMGWVGETNENVWEPVPGITSRLKCRGQVLETTQKVTYEVTIKELGYRPEPYAIADARMYSDGKPIVDMFDMSIRLTGQTREKLQALWSQAHHRAPMPASALKPAVYGRDRILAFATGRPSAAFGEPYAIFDNGPRVIARLPGPPFSFLDRVTEVHAEPWKMKAGGTIEAQYEVRGDEWYFAENRCSLMPFSVLLEIALQPCGWFAAYMGSALHSDVDLSFRNLGGEAVQRQAVGPDAGILTTAVRCTNVSSSGGMIIQHFEYSVRNARGPVYEGTTYFGFFSKSALANQVGIQEAKPYAPNAGEVSRARRFTYPADAPFPGAMLRMADDITLFTQDAGPAGLGFIRGTKRVNPDDWFFKAHFYQDPVWPGSLGLESFLQLMKVVAAERWGLSPGAQLQAIATGVPHKWIYRGQIVPKDQLVTVEALVTGADDDARILRADGFLHVDGRTIYQIKDFSLQAL